MITSSKISTTPRSAVKARSSCKNATFVGMIPFEPPPGSRMTAATWSGCVSSNCRTDSMLFGYATSIVSVTPFGTPVDVDVSNGG